MALGQTLINASLIGFGTAAVLSSATTSTGIAIWNFLTFDWAAAAASVAGHAIMSFLGTPIFIGLLALMTPGIIIAYVLPMIPYVLWMAGVCGWIILVCEAMVAVPLWMLAHMTVGGDGLHGRAIEGWGLLFNVVFRPTLMIVGLFLGYFVFDCMSWLIRESFGIAAGFVLNNGWIVSNFLGLAVLLNIFVMVHVIAALMSFRLVALLPHHLPRLIGFTAANRVDMEGFYQQAAWGPGQDWRQIPKGSYCGGTGASGANATCCVADPLVISLGRKATRQARRVGWTPRFVRRRTQVKRVSTMFSTGDMSGAMMLSNQLEMYRWEDHFRRMREQDGLAAQNAALRSELARLGAAYNELGRNFKHFANAALQMEKETGERIAQLERELAELRDAKAKTDARLQDYMAAAIRREFDGA